MAGYYRPQDILVMEAELARAKTYLIRDGVTEALLEANTPLLVDIVIDVRDRLAPSGIDKASVAADRFKRLMLAGQRSPSS